MKIIFKLKKYIKNRVFYKMPEPLFYKKKNLFKNQLAGNYKFKIASFGNLNKDKVFYVIRRYPGAGFFSNFIFILNHIRIAESLNAIPVVDMENFPTWYNEKKRIYNTCNAWEYYFKNLSNYKLKEVYKSKHVIFTSREFYEEFDVLPSKKNIDTYKKYIKIHPRHIIASNLYYKKNFKKTDKVLGVYLRGGEVKTAPRHPYPPTKKQVLYALKKIMKNQNYNKIFLSTKEAEYINLIKNNFSQEIFVFNSYDSKFDIFQVYNRKNHRYLLGEEILREAIVLSKLDGLFFNLSNVVLGSQILNINKKQKKYFIYNGYNFKNRILANYSWKIKSILPEYFGGFSKDILKKI